MSAERKGYEIFFLGDDFIVELPHVGLELSSDVLHLPELKNPIDPQAGTGFVADYIHYSVVMSMENRQAFFSAANLDQNNWKSVNGRRWFLDPRVGSENQISNDFYRTNPWDRGHLTRRTAVTWGSSYEARKASNDSCSYTNASLQHENFNQDEWRVPEKIVQSFDRDKNGHISVFTGPVFTEYDRWYTRPGIEGKARIPAGFWKVVAYVSKETGKLECQAYLMYQDGHFIADKRGQHTLDIVNYQVTISEIENLTGLEFPENIYTANPLNFFSSEEIDDGRTNEGPEAFEAPRSCDENIDPLAAHGVIFNRDELKDETKAAHFASRNRSLKTEDFVAHLKSGGVRMSDKLHRRARRRRR